MTIQISKYWKQFITKDCRTMGKPHRCEFCVGPDSLIVDCDMIKRIKNHHEPINDCIAFEKDGLHHVGIVEMKGKNPRLAHTLQQLDSGERIALQIIKDSGIKNYKIYKIIAATSYPPSFARILRSKRRRSKSDTPIISTHCNDTFSNARKKCH